MRVFIMTLLVIIACSMAKPEQTEAATRYRKLFQEIKADDITKSGKYEFRITEYSGERAVAIRGGKNESFKRIPIDMEAFTNGKDAYYTKSTFKPYKPAVYKYVFASGKEIKVASLPTDPICSEYGEFWLVSAVHGSFIYLTRVIEDGSSFATYTYDVKKAKLSKLKDSFFIVNSNGKYAVSTSEFHTSLGAYPITLYQFKASGIQKVKKLSDYGFSIVFIGNKLFYASCSDAGMRKSTLYKSREDGSGKKKIASFEASSGSGQAVIGNITAKSCSVTMFGETGGTYEYTYATKKMKKINQ